MEGGFRESCKLLTGCAVKREKRDHDLSHSSPDHDQEDPNKQEMIVLKDNKLQLTKAEIEQVREENQRLKKYLNQITEDYMGLQKKFRDAVDQQDLAANKSTSSVTHQERELVSLCLGRTTSSSDQKKDGKHCKTPYKDDQNVNHDKEGLALGLDCKFEVSSTITRAESPAANVSSADNSVEEVREEAGETLPPGKNLKKARISNGDDEVAPQNPAKKARVSVRVRCDTPTMNDGCQWRKYGQKIAKGNPCPRAYYRCTVSPSCPVRKQVQRCAQDMSILITTYEGTHNHPLPISATAMASTTSAAASMLMSGSSVSGSNPNMPTTTPTTTPAELHGLNFYLSDGSKPNAYYPHNSSISPSPSCPTITLDLTSNTISSSSTSSSSSPFNRMPSNFLPRYSTTNLNFSSWNNGASLSYGTINNQSYIKNQIGSLNFGRQPQENLYQSYMQKAMATPTQQSLQSDTIEAATKAITSDPNFQSALQAALSSIISSAAGGASGNVDGTGGDKSGQNSKISELFPVLSSFPLTSNANCLSSYMNKSTGQMTNSQPGSLAFSPPNSSPFSTSKSKSGSPDDSRDHVK